MDWTRRGFLGGTAALAGVNLFAGGADAPGAGNPWEKADGRASNAVFVRRAYLDLAGRLPTKVEAQGDVFSRNPDKRLALVDELLADEGFVD